MPADSIIIGGIVKDGLVVPEPVQPKLDELRALGGKPR